MSESAKAAPAATAAVGTAGEAASGGAGGVAAVGTEGEQAQAFHPMLRRFPPGHALIIGHRGSPRHAPENTLPSFERAVAFGADMLEMDVHLTSDGALIVAHDRTAKRSTNTTRADAKWDEYTLEEVKQLDAGYHFTPDDGASFPFRGKGVTIPTFKEVLERFPRNADGTPGILFNVDLKYHDHATIEKYIEVVEESEFRFGQSHPPPSHPHPTPSSVAPLALSSFTWLSVDPDVGLTTRRLATDGWFGACRTACRGRRLRQSIVGAGDRVITCSFNEAILEEYRRRRPDGATGASMKEVRSFFAHNLFGALGWRKPKSNVLELPSSFLVNRFLGRLGGWATSIGQKEVALSHSQGQRVFVWTVNEAEEMEALLDVGVDGVMTDDCELAWKVYLKRGLRTEPM